MSDSTLTRHLTKEMKAIKKISKAAKAAGKTRLDYVDETQSVISGEDYDTDHDPDDDDVSLNLEVSKNWEKIATEKRYLNEWMLSQIWHNMAHLHLTIQYSNAVTSRSKSSSAWHNTLKSQGPEMGHRLSGASQTCVVQRCCHAFEAAPFSIVFWWQTLEDVGRHPWKTYTPLTHFLGRRRWI